MITVYACSMLFEMAAKYILSIIIKWTDKDRCERKKKKKNCRNDHKKAWPVLDVSPKIWILIYLNQGVDEPWSVNYRIQWMCRLCHQILLVKKWKLKSLKPLSRYVCNIIPLWACGIYYIYAVQKIAGAVVIV